eukprot:Rhum_TRINITY_DN13108_c0_g1::Rhum_TRINITY_DN13108_c0_g1_i1::g.57360::m.57360
MKPIRPFLRNALSLLQVHRVVVTLGRKPDKEQKHQRCLGRARQHALETRLRLVLLCRGLEEVAEQRVDGVRGLLLHPVTGVRHTVLADEAGDGLKPVNRLLEQRKQRVACASHEHERHLQLLSSVDTHVLLKAGEVPVPVDRTAQSRGLKGLGVLLHVREARGRKVRIGEAGHRHSALRHHDGEHLASHQTLVRPRVHDVIDVALRTVVEGRLPVLNHRLLVHDEPLGREGLRERLRGRVGGARRRHRVRTGAPRHGHQAQRLHHVRAEVRQRIRRRRAEVVRHDDGGGPAESLDEPDHVEGEVAVLERVDVLVVPTSRLSVAALVRGHAPEASATEVLQLCGPRRRVLRVAVEKHDELVRRLAGLEVAHRQPVVVVDLLAGNLNRHGGCRLVCLLFCRR